MPAIITLTTDFGADSPYAAQMKGVILTRLPAAVIVDVSHSVPPQRVASGAMIMRDCCFRFPARSVHIGVVDPGVGSPRTLVACRFDDHFFVAPDNGLLTLVQDRSTTAQIVKIDMDRFPTASSTFHGRDVMAPVAADLAAGKPLENLGDLLTSIEPLPNSPAATVTADEIAGCVQWVDGFGNLVTNIPESLLGQRRELLRFEIASRLVAGLQSHYAANPSGTVVALTGSNGHVEISVVNGSAAEVLGVAEGAPVRVTWERKP